MENYDNFINRGNRGGRSGIQRNTKCIELMRNTFF